jgi:hypothetical protein
MSKIKLLVAFLRGKSPSRILVKVIKMVAEGDFGPEAQKVYWTLAGVKTWITAVIVIATFALETASTQGLCPDCSAWAGYLYMAAGILFAVGLYDGAVRADAPKKVTIERKG